MNGNGKTSVIKYLFNHPFIIYFFLLPVYTTPRLLGEDIPSTFNVLPVVMQRVDYYLFIFLLLGVGSFLLNIMSKFMELTNDQYEVNQLTKQRSYALLIAVFFVFTSYFMFNPYNSKTLFVATGAHFFCISLVPFIRKSGSIYSQSRFHLFVDNLFIHRQIVDKGAEVFSLCLGETRKFI